MNFPAHTKSYESRTMRQSKSL